MVHQITNIGHMEGGRGHTRLKSQTHINSVWMCVFLCLWFANIFMKSVLNHFILKELVAPRWAQDCGQAVVLTSSPDLQYNKPPASKSLVF